nr:unnamed protein product [Digitaria exilis]CAB3504048.1 unnamed protein product [Digitaria exilis]
MASRNGGASLRAHVPAPAPAPAAEALAAAARKATATATAVAAAAALRVAGGDTACVLLPGWLDRLLPTAG